MIFGVSGIDRHDGQFTAVFAARMLLAGDFAVDRFGFRFDRAGKVQLEAVLVYHREYVHPRLVGKAEDLHDTALRRPRRILPLRKVCDHDLAGLRLHGTIGWYVDVARKPFVFGNYECEVPARLKRTYDTGVTALHDAYDPAFRLAPVGLRQGADEHDIIVHGGLEMIRIDIEVNATVLGDYECKTTPVGVHASTHQLHLAGQCQAPPAQPDDSTIREHLANLVPERAVLGGWHLDSLCQLLWFERMIRPLGHVPEDCFLEIRTGVLSRFRIHHGATKINEGAGLVKPNGPALPI